MKKNCPFCRGENLKDDYFCTSCGAALQVYEGITFTEDLTAGIRVVNFEIPYLSNHLVVSDQLERPVYVVTPFQEPRRAVPPPTAGDNQGMLDHLASAGFYVNRSLGGDLGELLWTCTPVISGDGRAGMEVVGRNASPLGHIYLDGLKPTTWGGQRGNLEMIDHRGRTALWKGIQFMSRKRGLLQWISPLRPYTYLGTLTLGARELKTAVSGNMFKPFYSLAGIDEIESFFDRHTIMSAFFLQGIRPRLCFSPIETTPSRELARA